MTIRYSIRVAPKHGAEGVFEAAGEILTQHGFARSEETDTAASFVGPGMKSWNAHPLYGATDIQLARVADAIQLDADLAPIGKFLRRFVLLAMLMAVVGSCTFAILTVLFRAEGVGQQDLQQWGGGWRLFWITFIPFAIGGILSAGMLYVAGRAYLLNQTRQILRALVGG